MKGRLHIVPNEDLRDHQPKNCWCEPTLNRDGALEHHAADHREELEERGEPTGKEWLVLEETE